MHLDRLVGKGCDNLGDHHALWVDHIALILEHPLPPVQLGLPRPRPAIRDNLLVGHLGLLDIHIVCPAVIEHHCTLHPCLYHDGGLVLLNIDLFLHPFQNHAPGLVPQRLAFLRHADEGLELL